MEKKKEKNSGKARRSAVLLLVFVLAIVLVGMVVRANREYKKAEGLPEENETDSTQLQNLASFPEFHPGREAEETDFAAPDGLTPQIEENGTTQSADPGENAGAETPASSATGIPGDPTSSGASSTSATASGGGTTLHDYQTGNDYIYAYAGYTPQTANLNIADWRLLLVNRNYMLPQDYSPALGEAVKGTGVRLDARVAPEYQKMYDAALKDGIKLTPVSGYRSVARQKTNFDNKIQYYMNQGYDKVTATQKAAEIILPPGTSEHNAGLCMDIISLDTVFENTKEFAWLQAHGAEYGFILRYPKGKENITKITYEPWHWRYVGVDNAKKINQSGKCLEEYLGVK